MPTYPQSSYQDNKLYCCKSLSMQDIKYFHEMLYQKPKIQDHFIVKYITVKRRQAVKGTYSEKEATANYFVRDRAHNLV